MTKALTWAQALSWRLDRHLLVPVGDGSAADVVRRLGAVLAMDESLAELAVAVRRRSGETGGLATPADAALMMQLGAEAVFVGSGVFKSSDPAVRARAIVQATTHYKDADALAKVSEELGEAMPGIETSKLAESERLAVRGW